MNTSRSIRSQISVVLGSRIHFPAVEPDLPGGARERADVPEPDHGRGEVRRERVTVCAVQPHQRVDRPVVEELLVRVQQPGTGDEVPVVPVVELAGGERVQRREAAIAAGRRARPPLRRRERRAHVGVAVDAGAEASAPRHAHRVRAGQRRKVPGGQALGGEGGHQRGEVRVRAREVGGGAGGVRERRVAAAERHRLAWAAELHTSYSPARVN
uniref:Uncharacterized protein n=1 Tax=Arundo donax TaxID=35708 RepID=A0A0A9EH04_ARUDO